MAITSGYEYDIFISYAHDDNIVPVALTDTDTGWISQFHEYLEFWLIKRRGLKDLSIWLDKELKGNTVFDQAIQESISKSALFFVIHSHNYRDSDYCRQELDWFLEESQSVPNGVKVGDQSRIFNILVNNIHHNDWPEALAGTSGFTLHDAEDEEAYGYPTSPRQSLFDKQMRKLVEATASILEAMPQASKAQHSQSEQQNTSEQAASNDTKIFIADVCDSLQIFRKRLINEIGDKATILPALPPPYEANAHETQLAETLEASSLSIHLLDQYPGRLIDGLDETSFSHLQTETAIKSEHESLIWVPDTLVANDIEDEQQANWLEQLENGERHTAAGFHFVRSNQQAFIDQVKERIDELLEQTQSDEGALRYLIDTHQKDQMFAFQVATVLSQQGINVQFNQESPDPVKSLENFEQMVREVQNLIIMFGSVAPTWIKGRIQTAIKIVADQFQTDSQALENIWVFQLPNSPGMDAIGKVPPLIKINCLDNSNSQTINNDFIEQLLNKSGRGNV